MNKKELYLLNFLLLNNNQLLRRKIKRDKKSKYLIYIWSFLFQMRITLIKFLKNLNNAGQSKNRDTTRFESTYFYINFIKLIFYSFIKNDSS